MYCIRIYWFWLILEKNIRNYIRIGHVIDIMWLYFSLQFRQLCVCEVWLRPKKQLFKQNIKIKVTILCSLATEAEASVDLNTRT
jgi:hypothetical protein